MSEFPSQFMADAGQPGSLPGGLPRDEAPPVPTADAAKQQELIALQEGFIRDKRDLFATFLRNRPVQIKPGNQFCITYGEPPVIELDSKDWQEMQAARFSEEQMLWSTFHECAHLLDMTDDPVGMKQHFSYMKTTAKTMVGPVKQALERAGKPTQLTDTQIESFLYTKLHYFYNALDDVYVNNIVASNVPGRYGVGKGMAEPTISKLYETYLFPSNDLRDSPKSLQLASALLRRRMVRSVETTVDPAVDAILNEPVQIGTARYPRQAIIEQHLRPLSPAAPKPNSPSRRYAVLKTYLEPQFWKLLLEDVVQIPPKRSQPGKSQPGTGTPSGQPSDSNESGTTPSDTQSGKENPPASENAENKPGNGTDPWDTSNMDVHITEEMIDKFLKSKSEYEAAHAEPVAAPKLTPEAMAAAADIAHDTQLAMQYGSLSPEAARNVSTQWRKLSESVRPFTEEMSQVFDGILKTIDERISLAWQEGFSKGRFNTDHFIRKYGTALAAGWETGQPLPVAIPWSKLDTYDQREFERRISLYPNDITVRLVLDNSGSMAGDNILGLQQLCVLLYESLKSFEARVNHLFRLDTPFTVGIEVQLFADRPSKLTKPSTVTGEAERGLMLATLHALDASGGGTYDAPAWQFIADSFRNDPSRKSAIKELRSIDIAIEVTDGDTHTAQETNELVRQYLDFAGAGSALALKITNPNETPEAYEQSTFHQVFAGNGRAVHHPSQLAGIVTKLLEEKFAELEKAISVHQLPLEGME